LFPVFATGIIDTGGKFATGINNTSCGASSIVNISENYQNKLKEMERGSEV
jgi:hypothetical protein